MIATFAEESGVAKLVLFLLCALAVYAFFRSMSGEKKDGPLTPEEQDTDVTTATPSATPSSNIFPIHPLDIEPVRIAKFFFKTFDAVPGPPDPEVFADELVLELYNADTGHRWSQSYYVASPLGLAQVLRQHSWKYLYAPEILVVPRYDLDDIRRAVETRIVEDNEALKAGGETMKESV